MGAFTHKATTQPRSAAHRPTLCAALGTGTHCSFAYWPIHWHSGTELRSCDKGPSGHRPHTAVPVSGAGTRTGRLETGTGPQREDPECTGSLKLIQDPSLRQNFEICRKNPQLHSQLDNVLTYPPGIKGSHREDG